MRVYFAVIKNTKGKVVDIVDIRNNKIQEETNMHVPNVYQKKLEAPCWEVIFYNHYASLPSTP